MASGLEAYQAAKKIRSERDQRLAELEGTMKEKNIFDELLGIEREKSKVLDLDEAATANEQRLQDHINNPASPINSPEDLLTKWQSLKAMRPEDYKQEMLQRNKQLTGELPDEQRKLDQERLTGQRELERSIIAKNRPQSDIEGVDFQLNSGLDNILNKIRQPQASISASGVPALTPDQLASGQLPSINSPEVSRSPDSVSQKMSAQQKGGTKPPSTGGGNKGGTPELNPLAQYKELLKLQEERQAKSDTELADAQKQRDINAALGMITSGLSKAGAAYGGGSVTQLKGDTSAEEMLNKTADQKIADIREKMKNATETEKNVLQKQLTLAQMQKMRDDKEAEAAKLKLGYDKLRSDERIAGANALKPTADDRKIYQENRAKRDEAIKLQPKLNELMRKVDSALGINKKYQENSLFGTGLIAGGLSKLGAVAPKTQDLTAALNELSLDNMVKMFSGMSKAIDTDAERAFYQSTQPSPGDNPDTLLRKLNDRREHVKQQISDMENIKNSYTREGRFASPAEIQESTVKQSTQSQPTSKKDWMK